MTFDEMQLAIKEAERTVQLADDVTDRLARIIRNRLRSGKVAIWVLSDLKRELRDFNIHTGSWRK